MNEENVLYKTSRRPSYSEGASPVYRKRGRIYSTRLNCLSSVGFKLTY